MNEETEDLKNMIIHLVGLAEEHYNHVWFEKVDNAGAEIMNRLDELQAFKDKQEQGLLAEVIRCKDCKYFSGGGLWDNGHWCGRTARAGACDKVAENDFCSKAEALAKMGGK